MSRCLIFLFCSKSIPGDLFPFFFCTLCPIFRSIVFPWRRCENLIFGKCIFCKNSRFRGKRLNFQPIGLEFLFFYNPLYDPTISVIFSINCYSFSTSMTQKVWNWLILDPKYSSKSKKHAVSMNYISGKRWLFCNVVCVVKITSQTTFL